MFIICGHHFVCSISVSERTYLLYRAIHRSYNSGGAGIRSSMIDKNNPIAMIFTMHDASFLKLMSESLLHVPKWEKIVKNMTVERIEELANKYVDPNKMIWLVVGDAKTQFDRMEGLGFGKPIMLK